MSNLCPYCRSQINDGDKFCTNCGAPNSFYKEPSAPENGTGENYPYAANTNTSDSFSFSGSRKPRTIEELKEWAQAKNLPLADMRVFIGENYQSPRAFGIYREGDQFIVYKNKSDGSRAVRYKGPDEAHAVGELYDKMRDEIKKRKGSAGNRRPMRSPDSSYRQGSSGTGRNRSGRSAAGIVSTIVFLVIIAAVVISELNGGSSGTAMDGYYYYNDDYYYRQGSYWFEYDDDRDRWDSVSPDSDFLDNYSDYYYGYNYSNSYGDANFSDSQYYHNSDYGYYDGNNNDGGNYDDDDDDYDYTWDNNDTWDAGGTDWDSDW